jgi:hypothetical protein
MQPLTRNIDPVNQAFALIPAHAFPECGAGVKGEFCLKSFYFVEHRRFSHIDDLDDIYVCVNIMLFSTLICRRA